MYVGVAWVHPWLIALQGEYVRSTVCGCGLGTSLSDCSGRRIHKIDPYMVIGMLLYKGRFYVCGCGLGTSLADCFGRRVHKINPYMVTYYDCIRVDFMYVGVA